MTALLTQFDYSDLAAVDRAVVQRVTTEIRDRMGRTAQNVIEIGERLSAVKSRLADQQFSAWLRAEFDWGRTTAYRMIWVAERLGCSKLEQANIGASALYLLADPSTPDEVRDAFVEKAKNGEPVTHSAVKAAVTQAKSYDQMTPAEKDSGAAERRAAADAMETLHAKPSKRTLPSDVVEDEDDDDPCLTTPRPEEYTRSQPRKLWQQWMSRLHELTNTVTPEEVNRLATGWKSSERVAAAAELQDVVDALETAIEALNTERSE